MEAPAPSERGATGPAGVDGPVPFATTGWRKAALWPTAVALLLLVAIGLLETRDPEAGADLADLGQPVFYAIVLAVGLRAARRTDGMARRGWHLVALAAGVAFVAYLILIGMLLAGRPIPRGDDFIPLLVAVNALGFAGLVFLSPPEMARGSKTRLALDGLIAGGSLLFLVVASTEGSLRPSEQGSGLLSDLLYPAIDAAGLTVGALVLLRQRGQTPAWYWAMAVGAALVFVADATYAAGVLAGWAVEAMALLYLGLVATSALLAAPWPERKPGPEPASVQVAIYVPVGLAVAASAYDYVEHGGLSQSLFALLMVLVAAVIARTVLLLSENRRLTSDLVDSDAFKTQLLRFISHEIANPLSPLKVNLHMLRPKEDPPRAWQAIDRSVGRLESLSTDVRLLALAETKRIVQAVAPVDLTARLAAAVQAHVPLAQQRGLALEADLPPGPHVVPVDAERVDQVVDNLLSNALKFTPAGGRIDVRLRPADDGGAVLEVQDTGRGLDAEQVRRLFSPFGRVHGADQPGLGLGLYLCRSIVEAHGGRITVDSPGPGHGATFRVVLPGHPDLPPKPELPPAPRPERNGSPDDGVGANGFA